MNILILQGPNLNLLGLKSAQMKERLTLDKLNKKIKADAIITDQKNLPIAVLTADCVPILLYDRKKKIIAAIHAGWKGALKGIIQKVISFITAL